MATTCSRRALLLPGWMLLALLAATPLLAGQEKPDSAPSLPPLDPAAAPAGAPSDHPLAIPVKLARRALNIVEQYAGHEVVLAKRERVNGRLADYSYVAMKVRHEPMSVYAHFLGPAAVQGREAIFVEGKNGGNILGHGTGLEALIGTIPIDPSGSLAMQGSRFPVSMVGIKNLLELLIFIGEREMAYGECEVTYFQPARVDSRPCTCIEIHHPVRRDYFTCCLTRIFIEHATKLPIRVEQYDWPDQPGREPILLGEYTFLQIELTDDLTDLDFDPYNPAYHFAESGKRPPEGGTPAK